ncbi:MAG TPA: phosphoribosylaminoimidazolesuccinocarboxamide synthase [Anaerolineae bacterium]|nr:phosphoribosylaminoimidazolesuccinocarboxamide synthase [Anaerolineae bacterium]
MLTTDQIIAAIPHALLRVDLPGFGPRLEGKVRDIYVHDGQRILVTTDRVSAFDRVLGAIPFKGQVLNQLSAWWFEQVSDVVANHVLSVPDPNVTIAAEAEALPVEVIVRGYITGITSTALWTLYSQGVPRPYGLDLPAGLRKNDPLPQPVITPTTKATGPGGHDERLTSAEVVERGLVAPALWEEVQQAALAIFLRGQAVARQAGLILVDTKYEFGLIDGKLALIDEVHTPDSSRFWVAESYERMRAGLDTAQTGLDTAQTPTRPAERTGLDTAQTPTRPAEQTPARPSELEPESFDKEFLRLWFVAQGYRGDGQPPVMPPEFIAQVAQRYIAAYERLTGLTFQPGGQPAAERIRQALAG